MRSRKEGRPPDARAAGVQKTGASGKPHARYAVNPQNQPAVSGGPVSGAKLALALSVAAIQQRLRDRSALDQLRQRPQCLARIHAAEPLPGSVNREADDRSLAHLLASDAVDDDGQTRQRLLYPIVPLERLAAVASGADEDRLSFDGRTPRAIPRRSHAASCAAPSCGALPVRSCRGQTPRGRCFFRRRRQAAPCRGLTLAFHARSSPR